MPRTPEEKRAYQRGYSRGYNCRSYNRWPDHKPPAPPDEIVAKLVAAAQKLRDGVDSELALQDEDDEWAGRLGPLIDDVDSAMTQISKWLHVQEPH